MEGFIIRDAHQAAMAIVSAVSQSDCPLSATTEIKRVITMKELCQSGQQGKQLRFSFRDSSAPAPRSPSSTRATRKEGNGQNGGDVETPDKKSSPNKWLNRKKNKGE